MTIELGVLLGAYGGPQSFESVGSWDHLTSQTSFFAGQSEVHSSPAGGRLDVFSIGGPIGGEALKYDYAAENDAFERWSPDVTTHRLVAYAWQRIDTAAHSGDMTFALGASVGEFDRVPFDAALVRQRVERQVTSANNIAVTYRREETVDSFSLHVDDLLAAADVIDLHPAWDAEQRRVLEAGRHFTAGQQMRGYPWHHRMAFELPLRTVPGSEAELINRWWRNGWNLAFTLDSSDTAATWVVRIANAGPPFSGFSTPYQDAQDGVLQLAGLSNGLDF